MSADAFLLAMSAEIARLSMSSNPKDEARKRAIEVIAASYALDAKGGVEEKRTLERRIWLRMNYATWPGLKEDVLVAVNALPGAPLTAHEMSNWAYAMNLKRGREVLVSARTRRGLPRNRDGSFSIAAVLEQDADEVMGECPVTLADALEWGKRNGMRPSRSVAEDLRVTNMLRVENRLPPFTLIAPKPSQGPLPKLITHEISDDRRH